VGQARRRRTDRRLRVRLRDPRILRLFEFPQSQRGRYTLLEALPQMREDGSFEVYAGVCETGEAFENLVANALKFRGDAPAPVAVDGREGTRDWVITVADRGPGVRAEDRHRILAMFARADAERSGSGIGLAVCRRVVEAHGGRIWVEPAEGGGSAFRFTLPREEALAA